MTEWWVAAALGAFAMFMLLQGLAELAKRIDHKHSGQVKRDPGIKIDKFKEEFPKLEGCTLGNLRIDGGKVVGFVLLDKEGTERYILYLGADCKVEPYW